MDKNIKIAVAGTGYVGLSIATLLAQLNLTCHLRWSEGICRRRLCGYCRTDELRPDEELLRHQPCRRSH